MKRRLGALLALSVLSALAAARLAAQPAADNAQLATGLPGILQKVGFDQHLGATVPLDLEATDESGRAVTLGDYFDAKPVVLVLAYYRCPMLCSMVLSGVASSLKAVELDAGKQFQVVVASFDPRDTPAEAALKKADAVGRYGRAGAAAGWHFLTARQEAIRRLTESVGFRYAWDEKAQQFAHATGIVILTPQGKIARYFYGVEYAPRDVRLGLVEAGGEKIGTLTDQVLLFCFHYDPATGRYSTAILRLVRAGGLLTVAAIGLGIGLARRRSGAPAGRRGSA